MVEIDELLKKAIIAGMQIGMKLGDETMKIEDPIKRKKAFDYLISTSFRNAQMCFMMSKILEDKYKDKQ